MIRAAPQLIQDWLATATAENDDGTPLDVTNNYNGITYDCETIPVTFTAVDQCGNTGTATRNIIITDTENPVFTYCPPAATNVADEDLCLIQNLIVEAPIATDNCDTDVEITWVKTGDTEGSGSGTVTGPFNVGITTVTYTATDECGNNTTCTQEITIADEQEPDIITCPDDVTVTAPPPDCEVEVINIDPLEYTDNCNPGTSVVTWEKHDELGNLIASGIGDVNGTFFSTGITTVTYIVTDLSDNKITCTFTVTVNDQVPPREVTCNVNPIIVHAISGECDAQVTVPAPTAEDPCNEIFSITHDSHYGVDEFDASGRYPVGILYSYLDCNRPIS